MFAWALLLLTLVVAALAGFEGYDQLVQGQAKAKAARAETEELRAHCQQEHQASLAALEAAKSENLKLVQERGELAAARDEAVRAATESGAALRTVKGQQPDKPAHRKRR